MSKRRPSGGSLAPKAQSAVHYRILLTLQRGELERMFWQKQQRLETLRKQPLTAAAAAVVIAAEERFLQLIRSFINKIDDEFEVVSKELSEGP